MDPASLIPDPSPIPLQPLVLQVLLVLTFALHLLLMNVVLGGSIVAFFAELRRKKSEVARRTGRELAPKMTISLALAVNLGVAPLLFLQVLYGQFLYTSSVLIAWPWLALVAFVILAYYGLYIYNFRHEALKGSRVLLLGVCIVLLLAVAFVLSNNMTLMLRPERWVRYFDQPDGFMLNLGEPTLLPRYLHMVVAAVAVGGLFVALMAEFQRKRGQMPAEMAAGRVEYGMRWFTRTTLLQLVLGPLFLVSLPREVMLALMGGETLHTVVFISAMALVALVLYLGIRRKLWATVWTLGGLVLLMSWMRALVRIEYLQPHFSVNSLAIDPQYGPFALFVVSLLVGLAIVGWVLRQALDVEKYAPEPKHETDTLQEG